MNLSENFKRNLSPKEDVKTERELRIPSGGLQHLTELEKAHSLPKGWLLSVMNQETGGEKNRATAVSPAGAKGWFQFMPETAKAYKVNTKDFFSSSTGAAKMFADLYKQYKGDVDKVLAGYNWGSGNIAKFGMEKMPDETKKYIKNIKSKLSLTEKPIVERPKTGGSLFNLSPQFKKLLGIEDI